METIVETLQNHTHSLERCIITTGVSSLNYYNSNMQRYQRSNEALYNCMGIKNIIKIDRAEQYTIITDISDNNMKEILFQLFNYLLPQHVEIHVKLIHEVTLFDENIDTCMQLLHRLDKNRLIDLEIINKSSRSVKVKKEDKYWVKRFKNLFCFISPGNTEKTSIV